MAYPFAPAPSWAEFISDLLKRGASIQTSGVDIRDPAGNQIILRYMIRVVDGIEYRVPIVYLDPNEIVQPTVLRSTCAALKIDPASFGFYIA